MMRDRGPFRIPRERFAIALMTNMERALCEELVPKSFELVFREMRAEERGHTNVVQLLKQAEAGIRHE